MIGSERPARRLGRGPRPPQHGPAAPIKARAGAARCRPRSGRPAGRRAGRRRPPPRGRARPFGTGNQWGRHVSQHDRDDKVSLPARRVLRSARVILHYYITLLHHQSRTGAPPAQTTPQPPSPPQLHWGNRAGGVGVSLAGSSDRGRRPPAARPAGRPGAGIRDGGGDGGAVDAGCLQIVRAALRRRRGARRPREGAAGRGVGGAGRAGEGARERVVAGGAERAGEGERMGPRGAAGAVGCRARAGRAALG